MIPEHYLEYLALNAVMRELMSASDFYLYCPDIYKYFHLENGTQHTLDVAKLKDRISELQEMFLKDYLCDNYSSKEN